METHLMKRWSVAINAVSMPMWGWMACASMRDHNTLGLAVWCFFLTVNLVIAIRMGMANVSADRT